MSFIVQRCWVSLPARAAKSPGVATRPASISAKPASIPASAASGIDTDRVVLWVWIGGSALAGLGGVLYSVTQQVSFQQGQTLLLLMFAGITLGGLGTAYGAAVGCFVLGLFIQLSTLVVPTSVKNVGAMAVLILVLLFKPEGLFGRRERVG